jgi:hypothetical protein
MVNEQRTKYLLERLRERFSDIDDNYEGLSGHEYIRAILEDYDLGSARVKISELPTDLYNRIVGRGQITESSRTTWQQNSQNVQVGQEYNRGTLPNIGLPWWSDQVNQPTNVSITLPIRLINVEERKVESIIPSPSSADAVRDYAILSHSWGDKEGVRSEAQTIRITQATADNRKWYNNLYNNFRGRIGENTNSTKGTLYPRSYKSLFKSARALEVIDRSSLVSGSIISEENFLRDFRAVGGNASSTTSIGNTEVLRYRKSSENGNWHLTGTQAGTAYNSGWIDHNKIRVSSDGWVQGKRANGNWSNILAINHLWVDQLCIDQRSGNNANNVELDRELLKFRRYYANSTLTLVSINTSLEEALNLVEDGKGKKVVNWLRNLIQNDRDTFNNALDILSIIMRSEWRFSSWTYKEGWLSKQTVFMFDDVLVDGRFLAMVWAKLSGRRIDEVVPPADNDNPQPTNFDEFRQRYRGKYATPIGWAYEEVKQPEENLITIRLNVALAALIGRRRHESLDSLRAILAVLPYGHLVEVEKWRGWADDRSISDNRVFQQALCDVMKVGAMNGYGEFLTWFGLGETADNSNSWLPTIGNGGTFVTNMAPRYRDVYCVPGSKGGRGINFNDTAIEFTETSVTIKGFKEHDITNIGTFVSLTGTPRMNFYRLNQNNEVEADVLSGRNDVSVNVNGVGKSIRLVGTKEALGDSLTNGGEIGRIANIDMNRLKLLVPHNDLWKSIRINRDGTESTVPIALLVEKRGNDSNPRYRRIDLVKLLDTNSQANSALNQGSISQHTAQIEVWPNR